MLRSAVGKANELAKKESKVWNHEYSLIHLLKLMSVSLIGHNHEVLLFSRMKTFIPRASWLFLSSLILLCGCTKNNPISVDFEDVAGIWEEISPRKGITWEFYDSTSESFGKPSYSLKCYDEEKTDESAFIDFEDDWIIMTLKLNGIPKLKYRIIEFTGNHMVIDSEISNTIFELKRK